jgi:hypothetical protein
MLGWIELDFVGRATGFLFVMGLMRMAGDQHRAVLHNHKRIDPFPTSRSPNSAATELRSSRIEQAGPATNG